METKHTQGEWLIDNGKNIIIYNNHNRKAGQSRNEIAVIPEILIGGQYHIKKNEAEANAKLIAAAPDLLEALKPFAELLNQFDGQITTRPTEGIIYAWSHNKHGESNLTVEMLKLALEAIIKATK